jgi:hypothetical protein
MIHPLYLWVINLLTQFSIEESVLNIKLRHKPLSNRSDSKKSAHSGHMSHRGKGLIIVTAVLLLKATSHKTRFVALKRSIRAGFNFIDPLACDGTNTGRGETRSQVLVRSSAAISSAMASCHSG